MPCLRPFRMLKKKSLLKRKVVKADGHLEDFSLEKVAKSIWSAAQSVGGKDRKLPELLSEEVAVYLETKLNGQREVTSAAIGEAV